MFLAVIRVIILSVIESFRFVAKKEEEKWKNWEEKVFGNEHFYLRVRKSLFFLCLV